MGFDKTFDDLFVQFKHSHVINVISIHKHSSELTVCVNFGVHYDFLPKVGSTEFFSGGKIELSDCEVKVRLTPNPNEKDHWRPIGSESVGEIIGLIVDRADGFFCRYNLDGDIASIIPDDLGGTLPGPAEHLFRNLRFRTF